MIPFFLIYAITISLIFVSTAILIIVFPALVDINGFADLFDNNSNIGKLFNFVAKNKGVLPDYIIITVSHTLIYA